MLGGVRLRRLLEKSCFEGQIHLFKIGRKRAQKITVLVVILTGLSKFVPIKGAWWHPFLKKKKVVLKVKIAGLRSSHNSCLVTKLTYVTQLTSV